MPSSYRKSNPTIRQVALACGVSPSAVSFVLNNKPGQVSAETRERVLRTVRELGYRPRAAEPPSERRIMATLGVVVGVPGDSLVAPGYYQYILNGILVAADWQRLNLTLFTHSLFHADPHPSIRTYCEGRCDGVLVIAPGIGSPFMTALQERGFPFVAIGDNPGDDLTPCVDLDNIGAARQATEHLLEHGHRRIGFIGGLDFIRSSTVRRDSYRETLARHGLPPDPYLEVSGLMDPMIPRRLHEMLRVPAGRRPTALVGWNDSAIRDALPVLRELGLRVPEDISLIGFDDNVFAASLTPALTTMRQPYREISRTAVEMLLALIHNPLSSVRSALLPAELVVRDSVAAPRPPRSQ